MRDTYRMLNAPCNSVSNSAPKQAALGLSFNCSGTDLDIEYHSKAECSGSLSAATECKWESGLVSACHTPFVLGECKTLIDVPTYPIACLPIADDALNGCNGFAMKFKGSCKSSDDDDPCFSRETEACRILDKSASLSDAFRACFSRETEACRILDTSASPSDAFRACFDEPVSQKVAERVAMAALVAGDHVLSAGKGLVYEYTRIIVNQHRIASQKRSGVVKITHVDGELSLTPDHVLLVDGEWAAARTVKEGSSLSGSKVTAVSQGFAGIINPLTANGMIIAAGPTGKPVVSLVYPEWIATYMLNVAIFPLPISLSNLPTYFFPATAQAYYDEYLEGVFADHQSHLRKWQRDLPTLLIAPLIVVVDLLCAAGFVLYALTCPKALAALAAVAVVARVHRAKA